MKIGFDAKRYFHNRTGLGNYSRTIVGGLQKHCPEIETELYDKKRFSRTFRLGHIAQGDGCQLFHGLSNELPLDIVSTGLPSIVTLHDTAWRTFPKMYHAIDRKLYDLKYGWACRHASCVVAISESTKRDAMRFYGVPENRIKVIFQPVQDAFYESLDADTARQQLSQALPLVPHDFALYVGSINSRKNLLNIVKALELFPSEQRLPLIIVGNGREYRREVEQYIAQHQLQESFIIIDNLFDSHLLQCLYRTAQVFIYPSFYEGFGLPVVEASLQGCPVITSNVSSLPEAAGDGAILIDPNSVEALHAAIERVLTDSSFAHELGMKAERYARAFFNPEIQAHKLSELYQTLLNP